MCFISTIGKNVLQIYCLLLRRALRRDTKRRSIRRGGLALRDHKVVAVLEQRHTAEALHREGRWVGLHGAKLREAQTRIDEPANRERVSHWLGV